MNKINKETEKVIGIPFVDHVDQQARPEIENPKEFLKKAYNQFYINNNNLLRYGTYKLMGYSYNFRPYLKSYLYKQYGQWSEGYAPNKTLLRQIVGGKIDKIVDNF